MKMEAGFYVVRMPNRGMGTRLMIESRPFRVVHLDDCPDGYDPRKYAKTQAERFMEFVQSEHPKDHVFVIEVE